MDTLIEEYKRTHPKSQRIHCQAAEHFSGNGATHVMRVFNPFRPYITHARGCRKWDVDGHEYIDCIMGHGALILGHRHPIVVKAVQAQMEAGLHFGENHELEVELARLIKSLIPSAEKVEFCSCGQEANLLAIRLSRLFTGRRKILRFVDHYHGWADELAPCGSPGIKTPEVTLIPSNDLNKLEKELRTGDYAALIMEGGGGILGVQTPLDLDFVRSVEVLTRKHGTIWILDEVVTGFRTAPGGWQSHIGIKPDLTTLGKCLAGGLPVGAVIGRADLMDFLGLQTPPEKRMEHGGTWNALPLVCAAGVAACKLYQTGEPQRKANEAAATFTDGAQRALSERRLNGRVYGGSIVKLDLTAHDSKEAGAGRDIKSDITDLFNSQVTSVKGRLCLHLLQRGIATLEGSFFIFSAVHSDEDIGLILKALSNSLDAMVDEGFFRPVET